MSAGLDRVGLEEVLGRFVHEHRDELSTDAARCANRLRDVLGERVGLTGRQARALSVLVADGSVARWLIDGQADEEVGLDVDNVHKWATSSWSAALGFGGDHHAPPVSVSRSSGFPDELVDIGPQRRRSSGAIRFAQRPGGGLVRLSTVDGAPQTLGPDSVRDQLADLPAGVMRVDWVEQSERSVTFASRASSTRSLAQHVETDGKLDPRVALPMLSVVADTLTECHRLGMPHGALTLDSVLLDDDDRPMVADVGLCRAVGRPATTAADAQAFASICYSTLTGERPQTDDPGSVPDWRRLPILEVSPSVPGDVARAIESCFEGTPDETRDIAQLADVLRTAAAGQPPASWPAPSPTNQNNGSDHQRGGPTFGGHDHQSGTSTVTAQTTDPRKLALIGLIVAGLVVLVAVGFVLLRGGSDDSDVITTAIAEIRPGSVAFEPLGFGDDFVAERTWTVTDGVFEGRTTIVNDGDDAIEIVYDEVIPKAIARSAADLTFSPEPAAIIEDDPIVRFVTTIEGGVSFTITYATKVSTEPTTAVLEAWTEAWDVAYRAHVDTVVTPTDSDADADGVTDADDLCLGEANTPGRIDGCLDIDGDNVPDSLGDLCVGELGSATSTDLGCADADGDGVPDTRGDLCVGEVGSATSTDLGCADVDGDGVPDSRGDLCVGEVGSATSTDLGCADADGDGVPDTRGDVCVGELGSATSSERGCADADGDTFAELTGADRCPGETGAPTALGCLDADLDGYQEGIGAVDICPGVLGTVWGCPDGDGDLVADGDDQCQGEANGAGRSDGCLDTDGDGVRDRDDDCEGPQGPAANRGCPDIDKDNDGIVDSADACKTTFGVSEFTGCPRPSAVINGNPTVCAFTNYTYSISVVNGTFLRWDTGATSTSITIYHGLGVHPLTAYYRSLDGKDRSVSLTINSQTCV